MLKNQFFPEMVQRIVKSYKKALDQFHAPMETFQTSFAVVCRGKNCSLQFRVARVHRSFSTYEVRNNTETGLEFI